LQTPTAHHRAEIENGGRGDYSSGVHTTLVENVFDTPAGPLRLWEVNGIEW
jgi:hypothetical protein